HLYTNAAALAGRRSFDRAVGEIQSIPALGAVELFGILLPLAFHALYGVVIALQARPNLRDYPYARHWMFVIQRVTGFVALAFILLHLAQFRVPKLTGSLPWQRFYPALEHILSAPGMFAVYLVGVTACVVHLANGLWLAGNTWGLTGSEKAMRRAAVVWVVFGALLWGLGVNTLVHFFARCGGVVPLPGLHREDGCRDADVLGVARGGRETLYSASGFPQTPRARRPSPWSRRAAPTERHLVRNPEA
ncbi:MAG: hypothetical protein R3A52_32595, partial [Polyangiales bacterium]